MLDSFEREKKGRYIIRNTMLRYILNRLIHNERLIERMSESYVIRRAAQMTVSLFYRSKEFAQQKNLHEMTPEKFKSFIRSFQNNFKEEIEAAKKQLEKKK